MSGGGRILRGMDEPIELILSPVCPWCGGPPDDYLSAITAPRQLWCATDGCPCLTWNGTIPAVENVHNAREATLTGETDAVR